MSDYLTRGFQAQMTTAMESAVRQAMCDIMRIFEGSLHQHQMELVQKGEEVALLKVKLQTAELKLQDQVIASSKEVERSKSLTNEAPKEPEVIDETEFDFEVPDEWHAPLGSETPVKKGKNVCETPVKKSKTMCETPKKDNVVCPSVRLRPLSIPLQRLPVTKEEMTSRDICRVPLEGSTVNEKLRPEDTVLSKGGRGRPRAPVRNDMKKLLLEQTPPDQTQRKNLRTSARTLREERQDKAVKRRKKEDQLPPTESPQKTGESVKYTCKYCEKEYNTEFGHHMHMRVHLACRGCRQCFSSPSLLASHEPLCKKLQMLLAKIERGKKKRSTSREEKVSPDQENPATLNQVRASSIQTKTKKKTKKARTQYPCTICDKKFYTQHLVKEHMRVHTGERPFSCNECSKKFHCVLSLKIHTSRKHKYSLNYSQIKGDLAWTMPVEDMDDCGEDSSSFSKDWSLAVPPNKVKKENDGNEASGTTWQTMGVRTSQGFSCSLCQKVVRNKGSLIKHYRIHTRDEPVKCTK